MRATRSLVRFEGFAIFLLTFAELLAARLDPLRMLTIVRRIASSRLALPLLKNDRGGANHHGETHEVVPLQRFPRYRTEKIEDTVRVMTSWMVFNCAVVNS